MPFTLAWEPEGVFRKYFGSVSIQERLHSFTRICADPRFDRLRYTITHYLDVEAYEITEEATEEIAALHIAPLRTNPRIVMAAVAIRPDIVGAIRHFRELQFTAQPYGLFPTEEAARLWLREPTVSSNRAGRPWGSCTE